MTFLGLFFQYTLIVIGIGYVLMGLAWGIMVAVFYVNDQTHPQLSATHE